MDNTEMDARDRRIGDLEAQVRLLWGVLLRLPRLEGVHDTITLEAMYQGTRPMEPGKRDGPSGPK